ncbi:MAG: M23 family metallopeptidase, partial [Bacteroidia bacterium]|nr:M23 family metallopeptidase [Bacteroidia bacterium]
CMAYLCDVCRQVSELVRKYGISSPYGNRVNPITGQMEFHAGIDIRVPLGVAIRFSNRIPNLFYTDLGGYALELRDSGYTFRFFHLLDRPDDYTIRTGNSGRWTTGPHLHFEVLKDGRHIDPALFLRDRCGDCKGPVLASLPIVLILGIVLYVMLVADSG